MARAKQSKVIQQSQRLTGAVCVQAIRGAPVGLDGVLADFKAASSDQQRLRFLKQYAERMPAFPAELRTFENRVMGCTAQV